MQTPELEPRRSRTCTKCGRPRVLLAELCRSHLVELFEGEGEFYSMSNRDFDAIQAVARWFLRIALDGLPDELRTSDGPTSPIDIYALLAQDAEWKLAHLGLDMLGCTIMDTPPFDSCYRLEAPLEHEGRMLLRLQVRVPREATEQFEPRLLLVPCVGF